MNEKEKKHWKRFIVVLAFGVVATIALFTLEKVVFEAWGTFISINVLGFLYADTKQQIEERKVLQSPPEIQQQE